MRIAPAPLDLAWLDGKPSRAVLRRVHSAVLRGWGREPAELADALRSRLRAIFGDPETDFRSRARVRWVLTDLDRPAGSPAERLDRHKRPRRAAKTPGTER